MPPKNQPSIFKFIWETNFLFTHEIISSHILALKTKPFIILSGISGTGKTKIAQLFAEYMLQNETEEEKEKRLAFVPVRPDWTDNRGLLDYCNLFDQRYYTTKVLRLLIEAGKHPEKTYFIILDEMNLAKVEHYFSDFLSVMESRTKDKPEGESIELHALHGSEAEAVESTEDNPLFIPHEIHIPNNVYFTGTVNVDETTYMFSPKVLDRANVIEFNEVSFSPSDPILGDFRLKSDQQEVLNWFHDAETTFCSLDDFRKAAKDHPRFGKTVSELKDLLEPFHLHFGYRVANEMARFVLLAVERVGAEHLEDAIDIQILQKVLPKFHGTQGKLEEPVNRLNEFCEAEGFARSAKKLQRMLKDLSDQGYCSFIA